MIIKCKYKLTIVDFREFDRHTDRKGPSVRPDTSWISRTLCGGFVIGFFIYVGLLIAACAVTLIFWPSVGIYVSTLLFLYITILVALQTYSNHRKRVRKAEDALQMQVELTPNSMIIDDGFVRSECSFNAFIWFAESAGLYALYYDTSRGVKDPLLVPKRAFQSESECRLFGQILLSAIVRTKGFPVGEPALSSCDSKQTR